MLSPSGKYSSCTLSFLFMVISLYSKYLHEFPLYGYIMSKPTPGLPQKTVTGPQRLKAMWGLHGLTFSVGGREFCGLGSFWSTKGKNYWGPVLVHWPGANVGCRFAFPNLPHRAQFHSVWRLLEIIYMFFFYGLAPLELCCCCNHIHTKSLPLPFSEMKYLRLTIKNTRVSDH